MIKDINYLLKENKGLIQEREVLVARLKEAKALGEAVKKGNIDAILLTNDEDAKLKVIETKTADQTYRQFIENMSEGVITLGTGGVIIYSNSSFAKMIHLPLEKVIGKNFRNIIPIEYIGNFKHFFNKNSKNNSKVELSMLTQKGIRTHFIVSLNKLQLDDFIAINLVWTDVTDQKNVEEKLIKINEHLQNANKARRSSERKIVNLNKRLNETITVLENKNIELSAFAHVASHDLQEPLRKIITFSSILIQDYYSSINVTGQGYINGMQSASKRMSNLINDILEYSEVSNKEFFFTAVHLHQIVEEVLSNLEIVIKETKAIINIKKELPLIVANPGQMRQLFQNLLSNALKFKRIDTIPEISISYKIASGSEIGEIDKRRFNEKFCIIKIKDNGIGFSTQYNSKIFQIFQRLHSNLIYPGTGIGLSICKKIVDRHNGYIQADSKPDKGSLFTIIIPYSQPVVKKKKTIPL